MFDYKISKHPNFDEACRAFALRHNMAKLAERAGMNVQTLRNKLNPDQPHQLTAPEIWLLTDLTEDSTLVPEDDLLCCYPSLSGDGSYFFTLRDGTFLRGEQVKETIRKNVSPLERYRKNKER
ncbi:hypothetical protein FCZ36_00240 [Escherichia coli]|nr:hypothetical protein [Escherichia coli]EGM0707216.1 hypothetical protein [Escherichia coli]EGO4244585.1 hypothetical protein [Escherichia coli]MDN1965969.1 hypothetical protein [Escherichia coli]MDN1981548.1 hypothetical protein [Escherichia coli]